MSTQQDLNDLISIPKSLWDFIKKQENDFKSNFSSKSISSAFIKIRRQGSIATKTMINPLISKDKNDIDLDLAIVMKKTSDYENVAKEIKNELLNIYRDKKQPEIKSKAINFKFNKTISGKEISFSIDFVILFKSGNSLEVFNWDNKQLETSEPFDLIDAFREIDDQDKTFIVRLVKSLRDSQGINGLKSIFLINSYLRFKKQQNALRDLTKNYLGFLKYLEEDMSVINYYGKISSFVKKDDYLEAPKDFSYNKIIDFITSIKIFDIEYFYSTIDSAIKNRYYKIDDTKPKFEVHGNLWKDLNIKKS